jgi:hypothetical protein
MPGQDGAVRGAAQLPSWWMCPAPRAASVDGSTRRGRDHRLTGDFRMLPACGAPGREHAVTRGTGACLARSAPAPACGECWVHRTGRAALRRNRQRAGRTGPVSSGGACRTGVSRPDSILIAIQIDDVSRATATRTVAITTPTAVPCPHRPTPVTASVRSPRQDPANQRGGPAPSLRRLDERGSAMRHTSHGGQRGTSRRLVARTPGLTMEST